MVEPSLLMTIEFGTYGSFTGVPITEVVSPPEPHTGTGCWRYTTPCCSFPESSCQSHSRQLPCHCRTNQSG